LRGGHEARDNSRVSSGFSLVESVVALALAALTAATGIAGAGALADSLYVEAARRLVIDALLEGRRLAYLHETTVTVRTALAASVVEILPAYRRVELPTGVAITDAPADAGVDFRSSGLADNATLRLARHGVAATIVVNQRGTVR